MTVLLFANSEINGRVASTCLFYYMALSQLTIETLEELKKKGSDGTMSYKHFIVFLSLGYNCVVMVLNLILFSVGIGFV
jgi:hypothetical protein